MTKRSRPWGHNDPVNEPTKRALHPDTVSVRGAMIRSGFAETSEALFLTSGFSYDSAEQAEQAFMETEEHYLYSRFSNPTVAMFEQRLAAIEGRDVGTEHRRLQKLFALGVWLWVGVASYFKLEIGHDLLLS